MSVPAYSILKTQVSVFSETQQSLLEHNNYLKDTTSFYRTQQSFPKHNAVLRFTKASKMKIHGGTQQPQQINKAMNLLPWIPVNYKWWRTSYSVAITSNYWHNKSSKFRSLCIGLAITCATLLAAGQSEALESWTQSDWPLIRVKFHGKETVVQRRWWSETRKFDIKGVSKGKISTVRTQRSWRLELETSAWFSFYNGNFTPVIIWCTCSLNGKKKYKWRAKRE